MEHLHKQLKAMRKMRGMKGIELARVSGIPSCTISQIENGKVNATQETIERLAEALDCEIRLLPNNL